MSSSSRRIFALGAASLALGGILAFLLTDQPDGTPTEQALTAPGGRGSLATRLQEMNDADAVPEKQRAAERYNEDRWGHLAQDVEAMPQAGPGGQRRYQMTKVIVGVGRGGKPLYGRLTAQVEPEVFQLMDKNKPLKVGPMVQVKGFEPGPLWGKLKRMNENLNLEDVPPHLQHLHPDYTPPAEEDTGGATQGSGEADEAGAGVETEVGS